MMTNWDSSHLSPSERAPKRLKSCHAGDGINGANTITHDNDPAIPTLAPEIWALVIDFLPYQSVLQSAAVSRSLLHEAMPLVTMLHIDKPSQIHAGVASRYRDVRDIYIYSLVEFDENLEEGDIEECRIDEDTATRAVPFLCNFSRLERVFLGGQRRSNGQVEGFIPTRFTFDEDGDRMKTLIDAFSGAFRAGALPSNLWVAGLRCPRSISIDPFRDSSCLICRNACKSFPLESVIDFENEGSSSKNAVYGGAIPNFWGPARPDGAIPHFWGPAIPDTAPMYEQVYGLDVCLHREKIETIIEERPGGSELLYCEKRFMNLLGRGTRHVVVTDENRVLFVVKYDARELGDISRFIERTSIDIKKLSSDKVIDAIRRSFAEDERDPVPPRDQCYLAESSFYELKDMELPIEESDFLNADEWDDKKRKSIFRRNLFSQWRFT